MRTQMMSEMLSPDRPAELLQTVGVIGAIIMPHNLYLHSALVKSRAVDTNNKKKVREANMYFFIEAAIALFVSFIINVFIVSVFAEGLYGKTNMEIRELCESRNSSEADNFPADNKTVSADLYNGGIFLGCQYGPAALYIWAIGVLAAGQSSTMTGTYAGQFAMEGFLNLQWKKWMRVLFTRTIAVLPTFMIAFYEDIQSLSGMNDLLNCLMSLMLPFAVIPTITFTSNQRIMGEFTNGLISKFFAISLSILVIAVNIYFVISYVVSLGITSPAFILAVVGLGVLYLSFCAYLTLDMVSKNFQKFNRVFTCLSLQIFSMTNYSCLNSVPWIGRFFRINYSLHSDEQEEEELPPQ